MDCLWLGDLEYNNLSPLPLVLLMVLLLLGEGERDSDLDGDGGLDLLLLAGLLHSTLVKLVSVGEISLFLLPPPPAWAVVSRGLPSSRLWWGLAGVSLLLGGC